MKTKFIFLMLIFLTLFSSFAFAVKVIGADQQVKVHYFFRPGCHYCASVESSGILKALGDNVQVIKYDVSQPENFQTYTGYADKFNIPNYDRGVPFAVIECNGNFSYLSGADKITISLKPLCQTLMEGGGGVSPLDPNKEKFTIWAVIIAAIADGLVNPCALGVLAFLLIMLSHIGSKKRMIKIITVYIATIYFVYFISGFGVFKAVQSLQITYWVYRMGAMALIVGGLLNFKDFFWYGKGISLAIPESKKPLLEKYVHKASMPAALILGILVALFELPCTGIWYISVLGLLANSMTLTKAIPLLVLYNFIFVLPLIIISLIVIWGFPPEKIQAWTGGKKKLFRLLMGVAMIIIGLLMVFGKI